MGTTRRDEVVERMVAEAPASTRGILVRAFSGAASARGAIKAQCLVCVGYERAQIAACTGYACPLWKFRPFQPKAVEGST